MLANPLTNQTAAIHARALNSDEDFWRMRRLLIETTPITPIALNWDIRHLDGQRFHNANLPVGRPLQVPVQLWEDSTGHLVAFVLSEGLGETHFHVHPDYRYLEEEMLIWSEANLPAALPEGRRELTAYVMEYDALRLRLFAKYGYTKQTYGMVTRHMRIGNQPLAQPEVAAGYTLRTTQAESIDNCWRIATLLNAAFNRTSHTGEEFQNFVRSAPCYRPDLDLVAVAPDGSFAAYVGVAYDEDNRKGIFEPVCTHPDHQRRGLAHALMTAGLHRLRAIGAVEAIVETGDAIAANALYTGMGFTEAYKNYAWKKEW